jgi:hypothetical protein
MKDLSAWVDNWEQATTIAKDMEVLATTRASEWFEDSLITVGRSKFQPSWADAYAINKDPQVEDNILDYRTVCE